MNFQDILLIILAYLIGSIPFGLIISKIKNIDIRKHGSGNIGATNVTRVIGKKLGFLTFFLDSLKPIVILCFVDFLHGQENIKLYTACASIMGHVFSIWLKFKGGKGVATALSSIFYLNPFLGILMGICWLLIFKMFNISSLGSIFVFIISPIYSYVFETRQFFWFSLFISLVIIAKHYKNIINIINNKENKFK